MVGHKGQVVGYVRVSAADQNPARQLEGIGKVDRLFEEKVSGRSVADREQLTDMDEMKQRGEVLNVEFDTSPPEVELAGVEPASKLGVPLCSPSAATGEVVGERQARWPATFRVSRCAMSRGRPAGAPAAVRSLDDGLA